MAMIWKISIFIGFLVLYILYVLFAQWAFKSLTEKIGARNTLLMEEATILVYILTLFVLVGVLSQFWNLHLVLVFLVVMHTGILASLLLGLFFGTLSIEKQKRAVWTGIEFTIVNRWWGISFILLSVIMLVGYPITAAISYFGADIPSISATQSIFRTTLIFFFVLGWIGAIPAFIGSLSSKNIDESTRLRFIITRASAQITNALFLSLLLWSYGLVGTSLEYKVGDISLSISPVVTLSVLCFFIVAYLAPYFLGAQQAKKWKKSLLEKQKYWIDKIVDALDFPKNNSYTEKLNDIYSAARAEREQFVDQDKFLVFAEMTRGNRPPDDDYQDLTSGIKNQLKFFDEAHENDPRFCYVEFLNKLETQIEDISEQLDGDPKDENISARAESYSKAYSNRKDELSGDLDAQQKTKPPVFAGAVLVLSPLFSGVLGKLGEAVWDAFVKAVGQ